MQAKRGIDPSDLQQCAQRQKGSTDLFDLSLNRWLDDVREYNRVQTEFHVKSRLALVSQTSTFRPNQIVLHFVGTTVQVSYILFFLCGKTDFLFVFLTATATQIFNHVKTFKSVRMDTCVTQLCVCVFWPFLSVLLGVVACILSCAFVLVLCV